jgi:hypothetical protein
VLLTAPLAIVLAAPAAAAPLQVEHAPPACFLADRAPRLVACLAPRATRAQVRLLFRADGSGPWYAAPLAYDVPCYRGTLPRPSRATGQVSYVVEAVAGGVTARSAEHAVPVAAEAGACPGRPAAVEDKLRASWTGPPGSPRTPPGFEGSRPAREGAAAVPPAVRASPAPRPAATAAPRPWAAPAPRPAAASGGGHGRRNLLLAVVGAGAAGGGAVALAGRNQAAGAPATTLGTGLPSSGVAGTYVGTETVSYPGGCVAMDDVVLNLEESGGLLSGVLTFTVRTCGCCALGRGANPVSGARSGTTLRLETPVGFSYSGSFEGNRLSGSLAAPGGVGGTWAVDKR